MFEKILIGIDGNDGGRDAVALAKRLAGDETELVLAFVHAGYPVTVKGAAGGLELVDVTDATARLAQVSQETGIRRTLTIGSASVGAALHELAKRESADLLVIGSTRRGPLERILIGDDTRETLRGAPCSVAVAPAGYADSDRQITRIGVGYDASDESNAALAVARALAAQFKSSVATFQVYAYPEAVDAGNSATDSLSARAAFEELARDLADSTAGEGHMLLGSTVGELTACSLDVDLLVVGHRRLSLLGRILHASTSQQLARTVRCPLLVIVDAAVKQPAGLEPASASAMALASRRA
jgi:nucleotide-binding universal stress UspA family protein